MKIASIFVVTAGLMAASTGAATDVPVTQVLDRASMYVCEYILAFSSVVAEERYQQDAHPMAQPDAFGPTDRFTAPPQHADLRSDLLFVKTDPSDGWLTFRDVFSVNGQPIRDRAERLTKLFVEHPSEAIDRAADVVREGYRYNVGSKDRTVANPLVALAFLQAQYRDRFEFRLSGIDTSRGPDVWILRFKERVRPTILRTVDNRNVPSAGRFWIDGASGRVLQTELETSTHDRVMTTFTFDERLGLDVPAEMRDIAWYNGVAVTGTATYTNFRRFEVVTDEKLR